MHRAEPRARRTTDESRVTIDDGRWSCFVHSLIYLPEDTLTHRRVESSCSRGLGNASCYYIPHIS